MCRFVSAFFVLPLWLVAACATSQPDSAAPTARQAMDSDPRAGLPAQELSMGECGLFLYSLSGEATFVFFSRATDDTAKMLIDNEVRLLGRTSASGEIFGQFMTQTGWISPETGHRIDLQVEPGESMIDGQRVSAGRIKLLDSEGWETIIPIGGVRACMNRPDSQIQPRS